MTATTVSMGDVEKAIVEAMTAADDTGRNWHYVRVWPDGTVNVGEEVSECVPESEYYGRVPHPVTVWAEQSKYSSSPGDNAREWLDCQEDEAEFYASESPTWSEYGKDWCHHKDRGDYPHCTLPKKLGGWLDLDLSETMADVREQLEACDWLAIED